MQNILVNISVYWSNFVLWYFSKSAYIGSKQACFILFKLFLQDVTKLPNIYQYFPTVTILICFYSTKLNDIFLHALKNIHEMQFLNTHWCSRRQHTTLRAKTFICVNVVIIWTTFKQQLCESFLGSYNLNKQNAFFYDISLLQK